MSKLVTIPTSRPILFSAPMVRAILEGRKTQTRRVVKLTACGHVKEPHGHRRWHPADPDAVLGCPYGRSGDRLWVREIWRVGKRWDETQPRNLPPRRMTVMFGAGGSISNQAPGQWEPDDSYPRELPEWAGKLRPSIHMPRWASRITLELSEVRIERLQEITEADARAEGVEFGRVTNELTGEIDRDAIEAFEDLWCRIHSLASWDANPWVWVLKFKRLGKEVQR